MATHTDTAGTLGSHLDVRKMPAHWLMARLGKRVLRPGGRETTRWLLHHAAIGPDDDVVEFAPGLGHTGAAILARQPRTYTGIDRDGAAARATESALARAGFPEARVLHADASAVPLESGSASIVVGEAMLSMQTAANKQAIMNEARRLLRPGGRYVIHELALTPDTGAPDRQARVHVDLSSTIHVGVRIGTMEDWITWVQEAGFTVQDLTQAPMRLLELDRLIADEGVFGTARFVANVLRTPGAPHRLREVRRTFRAHREDLCAIGLIACRDGG